MFVLVVLVSALLFCVHAAPCRQAPDASHDACGLPYAAANFQSNYACSRNIGGTYYIGRPKTIRDIQDIVRTFPSVRAVGVGHSWTSEMMCPLSDHDDDHDATSFPVVLTTTELRSIEPYLGLGPSPEETERPAMVVVEESDGNNSVEVDAGITQRTLLDFLSRYRSVAFPGGLTLPAFSWFIDQTMGGAVATGTHGSSLSHGSLSQQIVALEMVTADGNVQWYTPEKHPHLFSALRVSVGRLGVITRLRINVSAQQPVDRRLQEMTFEEFVDQIEAVQEAYRDAVKAGSLPAVLQALASLDETQVMWAVPLERVWRSDFTRLDKEPPFAVLMSPSSDFSPEDLLASMLFKNESAQDEASATEAGPDTVYREIPQTAVSPNRAFGPNGANPRLISTFIQRSLNPVLAPGVYARTDAYLSMTEAASRTSSSGTPYDQYEFAVPLEIAASCLRRVGSRIYGPDALYRGFRTPGLIRFVSQEDGYLSLSGSGPVMYVNLEDYGKWNGDDASSAYFLTALRVIEDECGATWHWGKAGWQREGQGGLNDCFDGQADFGDKWCHFGCAVQTLDPHGKFDNASGIWRWSATSITDGTEVEDLATCCDDDTGFLVDQCSCAPAPRQGSTC
jgi:FAD/FMN-containing dehydrogenase